MLTIIKDILSEKTNASCMRFCTMAIVLTVLFNWVVGTIAVLFIKNLTFNIAVSEVVALFGALGFKWGQKQTELKNGGHIK